MKRMKKLAGAWLFLFTLLAAGLCASAAEGTHSVKITAKTQGHTYQAWQIFSGTYYEGVLSDVDWGDGVDNTDGGLLTALKNDSSIGAAFTGCEDAADVADVLADAENGFANDSDSLDAFANVVSGFLKGTPAVSGDPVQVSAAGGTEYVYTIGDLADGYYFIKEAKMEDDSNDAYSKFMLQVAGDVKVRTKAEAPAIDKKIDGSKDEDPDTTGALSANNASIGERVPFQVTSQVPAMDGYEKYYFIVTDTLSKGLTFNNDVEIQIDSSSLTKEKDFTVAKSEPDSLGNVTVTIVFKDFVQYKEQAGEKIQITYSATVNSDAVIGTAGNLNSVKLTYSNNPNVSDAGDPEDENKPGPDSPTGETPASETRTYVTGLKIQKVDDDQEKLIGAEFQLTGTRVNTVLVYQDRFTQNEEGTYWKLKDGTYTMTPPVISGGEDDTSGLYESTEIKYIRTQEKAPVETSETVKASGWVDQEGILRFDGLAAGEYEITELTAPDGFNRLEKPIKLTIGWSAPTAPSTVCTWTVTGSDGGESARVDPAGIIKITVQNESGATLPSTGGTGTVIFYTAGGLLILAGIVLLAVKRNRNAHKK